MKKNSTGTNAAGTPKRGDSAFVRRGFRSKRTVADAVVGAEVLNAVEGGVGIRQAAQAHSRMPNAKAAYLETPQFQGHTFEQQAVDAQNVRHPLDRWKLNGTANEAATDATAADGTKLQMKKGYGQSDGPNTEAHQQGRRNVNRQVQKSARRKLDEHGHESGKVVTTKGDRVDADPRVVESPVGRERVEQATERYAQALKGLSRRDLRKLAGQGAKKGAMVGAGISSAFALYGLLTGELEWDEAAEQIVVGTATGALGGSVGSVLTGMLEAAAANAGDGAAVVAPKLGRVLGRAGIVGVAVSGVTNVVINGYAVAKGDKEVADAAWDTAKGTAFGAAGVVAAAGVATIGTVAAAPAVVTFLVVSGAAMGTSIAAEQGYKYARNSWFGDPADELRLAVVAAEADLIQAVADYEQVTVHELLGRLGSDSASDGPDERAA